MKNIPKGKYNPYPKIDLPNRQWPSNTITKAPIWCSVDLRDGNQALITPMDLDKKLKLFSLLLDIGFKHIEIGFPGFKHIEIGFPSASKVEFDFLRHLIDNNLIPDDVTIQVLVQAREHLIQKTFDALKGVKKAIVHLYNSTSIAQRKIVFQKSQEEIIDLALKGVINLPATVEAATPNIYADQIEWMGRHLNNREHILISTHTHNDRGTSVAATELALLAGADRVEGTLLSNGERTGNVDIITLALNMTTQGVLFKA